MESAAPAPFRHEAFVYRQDAQFLRETSAFVRTGLSNGEAVLVAAPGAKLDLLADALGPDAAKDAVEFLDLSDLGRNPGRIFTVWLEWAERNAAAGRAFRGVCEPLLAGRPDVELAECRRLEQLLNLAFERGPAWSLLCPHDGSRLPEDVLEWVRRTHSSRVPPASWAVFSTPLPEYQGRPVAVIEFDLNTIARVRTLIAEHAAHLGLDRAGEIDMALVASELASNSVTHGGGTGTLRLWRDPGYAVCEVRDRGVITDEFVGLRRPDFRKRIGGAGLWAVNRICALVVVRSSVEFGTVVRAHLPAAVA